MPENDHLRQTLDHYKQLRQQKLDQLREELAPIELMIRQLERDLGVASNGESAASSAPTIEPLPFPDSAFSSKTPIIRPDEFYRMTQTEAAKTYLRKVGQAVSFEDLVVALRKGGAQLGGVDPKRTLYVSLARNPMKEFVWPSEGFIGLSEFYGRTAKTVTPRKRDAKIPKMRRVRRTRKAKGKIGDQPKTKGAEKIPSADTQAMHELMQDGKSRTAAEIIAALGQKLSRIPNRMSIVGSLNAKNKYEKSGDQYRAIHQE